MAGFRLQFVQPIPSVNTKPAIKSRRRWENTPHVDPESIAKRLEAFNAARWSNAMEGRYECAKNAAALEQYARREIDRAERDRRLQFDLWKMRASEDVVAPWAV